MIKIQDNKVTIDLPKGLNSRQNYRIKTMINNGSLNTALQYITNFKATRRSYNRVRINDYRDSSPETIDKFYGKKDYYFKKMKDLINTEKSFRPDNSKSLFVGVEIECLFPVFEKNNECSCCDGTGIVYDDDGNERECPDCDGTGESETCSSNFESLRELFESQKITRVSIKSDGSINATKGFFGVEFNVLCPMNDLSNLKKTCDFLNKHGAKVNKSCGMHIHLDARHIARAEDQLRQINKIRRNFERTLKLLVSMVPESRRRNSYCEARVGTVKGSRYCAVNMSAFDKYKTIEIRLHSSTTDFQKIQSWIDLNFKIMTGTIKKEILDLNDLTDYIELNEDTLEYFGQRIALFSGQQATSQAMDLDNNDQQAA